MIVNLCFVNGSMQVRKADFLMLKMDSVQTSNARLVVSAKSGFSLVRPSGDRKVGSRRSSAL